MGFQGRFRCKIRRKWSLVNRRSSRCFANFLWNDGNAGKRNKSNGSTQRNQREYSCPLPRQGKQNEKE